MKVALGGQEEEVDENALDKAIDFVQEHVLHQGPQKDEGFIERLKDEQLASAINKQYKHSIGHEFPVHKKH
ncbi:hypothetical protein K435DRAFT_676510 [Dendrothele bispora CBS 962.96]|uniref:Uncharacterized protein n=1 Tax=Dendrothele bispora (strain CBS 962.96) TaxID=1314807 RepID=A0A4S8LMC6_DENBC|nr:hypothetical protein K435DRAFT_676510 [Dendrothele bispora CBS 962.96]